MLLSPFFSRKKPPLYVAVDIASHSIKSLSFEGGDTIKVLDRAVVKLPLGRQDVVGGASVHHRVLTRFRELLFVTLKKLGRVPDRIYVALGPQVAGLSIQTWKGVYKTTKKYLRKKELLDYLESLSKLNAGPDLYLFYYPLSLYLNRYPVDLKGEGEIKIPTVGGKPVPGLEVEFGVAVFSFPREVGRLFMETKDSLGGLPIEFVSPPLVVSRVFSQAHGLKDAFWIDLGRDETALFYTKDGVLVHFTCFSGGARQFIHRIAQERSITFTEAEDLGRQYADTSVDGAEKETLNKILSEEALVWKERFLTALNEFYRFGPLPQEVLLLGVGASIAEVRSVLRDPSWIHFYSYVESPKVRLIDPTILFSGDSMLGYLSRPEDIILASLVWYLLHPIPLVGSVSSSHEW